MKNLSILIALLFTFGLFYMDCQDANSPVDNNLTGDNLSKKTTIWKVPGDFATINDALVSSDVLPGHTILVGPGNFAGAFVSKSVTIKGVGKAIIDSGPAHGSGLIMGFRFLAGSDGATISNLAFTTDLSIMNGAAVNNVTIDDCTFLNSVQAISNWRGNGWNIHHNVIKDLRTRNGGGIGILVGDYLGGTVKDNQVSHNKISGMLAVFSADGGGYDGSGIVLYADFRSGSAGAEAIKDNFVTHNTISLVSNNSTVVDVNAFELTDSRDDINAVPFPVLFDNSIGFNDFRGTANQILLTPLELGDYNYIDRNLGDNRGHGLHPSFFKP